MTLAVGFLRTMSHRICRRNTERTTERTFADFPSLHLHCGPAACSRRDQLRRSVRSYPNRTRAPRRGLAPAWSPRVHTLLHYFAGCSMEPMATKGLAHSGSAVAKPSQQGMRKSNGINAAPSCHAESFVAM